MLDLVAEGQALDLGSITRLQQLKTGALIEFAVEAACIMGRLPPEARTPYRGYARDIGLAFQIADDLLDHAGDEAAAGKRLRKDARRRQGDLRLAARRGSRPAAVRDAGRPGDRASRDHGEEADLLRAVARYVRGKGPLMAVESSASASIRAPSTRSRLAISTSSAAARTWSTGWSSG